MKEEERIAFVKRNVEAHYKNKDRSFADQILFRSMASHLDELLKQSQFNPP